MLFSKIRAVVGLVMMITFSSVGGDVQEQHLLTDAIRDVWKGIKMRNIDAYKVPLVHRPFSEIPGDAVSEGVGYGMLVACYLDDQQYFDKIWNAGEAYMWNGMWYDWRTDIHGERIAYGAATDAEQDIAFALVCAHEKVEGRLWKNGTTAVPYLKRGLDIMQNMWNYNMIVRESCEVAPGAGWGGVEFVNPGYFAPAWYRVFKRYDESNDWQCVIDRCYDILSRSPGYQRGLVPDWMRPNGEDVSKDQLGYNAYGGGRYMYKDAIRVFWRIGVDLLWNPSEERASVFLDHALRFISSDSREPNYYQMNGSVIPDHDRWVFNDGHSWRTRQEYSALTVGMWAIVPYAVMMRGGGRDVKGDTVSRMMYRHFQTELLSFRTNHSQTYWGSPSDYYDEKGNLRPENEMYFEQFLGLFGALVINGNFTMVGA